MIISSVEIGTSPWMNEKYENWCMSLKKKVFGNKLILYIKIMYNLKVFPSSIYVMFLIY